MEDVFNIEKKRKSPSCCMGCLVTVIVLIVVFAGISIYMYKQPFAKDASECLQNMTAKVKPAVDRYYDSKNEYPEKLSDLKDYLSDSDSIYCPIHKNGKKVIYEYNKNAKDNQWILRCHNHFGMGKELEIYVNPNGKFGINQKEMGNSKAKSDKESDAVFK